MVRVESEELDKDRCCGKDELEGEDGERDGEE